MDQDAVDWVDNYDNTMKEPALLPATFPNILVSANQGIAVGMASQICGFNLGEVCDTAIAFLKNLKCRISDTLLGPDFSTGGEVIYEASAINNVYDTGRGAIKIRGRYRYIKSENVVEIYEIPYTTTEAIIDKVAELIKAGKLREVSDMRDETDLSGLKLAIDLKRGVAPDRLMAKLYKLTPLQDSISCNFIVLISGMPRVMGVRELLAEWCSWRQEAVRRRTSFSLKKKKDKLHLLEGLERILLNIDEAIRIIRETEKDSDVVPNLMNAFEIDEIQAEYVAEIRLRNINKEYILNRTQEKETLTEEIVDLEDLVSNPARIKRVIQAELRAVKRKYVQPRRTAIIYEHELETPEEPDETPDYPVTIFLSNEGYFKKITPQSLRMADTQKFKEGDLLRESVETSNKAEVMFFSNKQKAYKVRLSDFSDTKASAMGDYLPSKLGMEPDEAIALMLFPGDYSGTLLFFYENGKAARVELSAYATQSNRRRLTGAYSDKSPLVKALFMREEQELVLYSSGRALVFSTTLLMPKSTRTAQGVQVMNLKANAVLSEVKLLEDSGLVNVKRYRCRNIPASGAILKEEDHG